MRTAARVGSIVLLVALLAPMLAAACPLCKDASDGGAAGTSMWRGMFWSILLMISTPFAMVGTMIFLVVRARRRREAAPAPGGARP